MKKIFCIAMAAALLVSCDTNEPDPNSPGNQGYASEVLILNEGQFLQGDADLTAFNPSTKAVEQDVFMSVNGAPLGDILQSAYTHQGKTYLVLNNSNKMVVVDAETFEYQNELTGLSLPRHFMVKDGMGYLTTWESFSGPGFLLKIDLADLSVVDTAVLGVLPEAPVDVSGSIWVPNSGDSTVSVLDADFNVNHAYFGGDGPNSIVESNGNAWVLHQGKLSFSGTPTQAKIVSVDPQTLVVNSEDAWTHNDATVSKLSLGNLGTGVFIYNGITVYDFAAGAVEGNALSGKSVYGLGYRSATNTYYAGISPAFDQAGYALTLDQSLNQLDSIPTGVGPNGFVFP